MKILHFIYDHPKNIWVGGGGARRVETIASLLADRGHQVRIVCGKYPGCNDYSQGNVAYSFIGSSKSYWQSTFSFALKGRALACRLVQNCDVIIEDFAPWNPLFTFRLKQRPAILQIQNHLGGEIIRRYYLLGLPFYLLEQHYPRHFAHAIVINEALNRVFHTQGKVIPMGVEESYLGVPSTEGDYVAFLGRLDFHQKGLDILLRAMQGLSFPLKIAGEGPAWPRLQRLIEDQANVEWVGKVEGQGKIDFLRHAKFVVVPSRFEGQGMVVVEATALGKSVIVSDIPELAYARRHGFALAFRKGSWPDLRQKMQQLWEQETLRHQLEQPTRDYARNSTWPRLTDQFETYCLNLIQNK